MLVMGKLRLRELGKVQTGPESDILDYDPSGRKIRVFWGLVEVVLGVWKGDIQRVVPELKEGKGQPGCWGLSLHLNPYTLCKYLEGTWVKDALSLLGKGEKVFWFALVFEPVPCLFGRVLPV